MSEELEAFKRIQCNYVHVFKARENGKTQLVHDLNIIRKALEVLEIVKSKQVHIARIDKCDNVLQYNMGTTNEERYLTPEQFDLLKEVLL